VTEEAVEPITVTTLLASSLADIHPRWWLNLKRSGRRSPIEAEGGGDLVQDLVVSGSDQVLDRACRRAQLTYVWSVAALVAVSILAVASIAVSVALAVTGRSGYALGTGGLAFATLFGSYVYKPLDRLAKAGDTRTRLDLLVEWLRSSLKACAEVLPANRLRCETKAWKDALDRFAG
jgi:hypothetical protein